MGGKITLHTQEQDLALYIAPVGKGPTPDSYIFYTLPIKSIFQCKCTSLLQLCTITITHTHTHTHTHGIFLGMAATYNTCSSVSPSPSPVCSRAMASSSLPFSSYRERIFTLHSKINVLHTLCYAMNVVCICVCVCCVVS